MKKFFENIKLNAIALPKRFFTAIVMLLLVATVTILGIANVDFDARLLIFGVIGFFLSVSITLLLENYKIIYLRYLLEFAGVALVAIYCLWLPQFSTWNQPIAIQVVSLIATFVAATFFTSFFGRNKDISFWNFTKTKFLTVVFYAICGSVLYGGLAFSLVAVNSLFNVHIPDEIYQYFAVFVYILLIPLLILIKIPAKEDKFSNEVSLPKIIKIPALYILLPLLCLYFLIMLGYLVRIIYLWELPNGWVSILVSVLSLGGLLFIMSIYPSNVNKSKLTSFISKYFGVFILPFLVLMSIGIIRRISDYGITINRLLILILNLYFYGIYLYIFLTKGLKIKWILIAACIIAILAAFGPWSLANITQRSIKNDISNILLDNKLQTYQENVSEAKALNYKIFDNLQKQDIEQLETQMDYLSDKFGISELSSYFVDSVAFDSILGYWTIRNVFSEYLNEKYPDSTSNTANTGKDYLRIYTENNTQISLPDMAKYHNMSNVQKYFYGDNRKAVKNDFVLKPALKNANFDIKIPLRDMYFEMKQVDTHDKTYTLQSDKYLFLIDDIEIIYDISADSFELDNVQGVLFY